MSDFLRCIKCKNLPSKPYECHQCGYLHCYNCLKFTDSCGVCKKPSKYKLSKLAELLINNETVTCKFCSQKLPNGQKIKAHHYDNCPSSVFKCSKGKCDFLGTIPELLLHVKGSHEQDLLSIYRQKNPKDNFPRSTSVSSSSNDLRSKSVMISNNTLNNYEKKNMKSESNIEKSTKYQEKKDCCIF